MLRFVLWSGSWATVGQVREVSKKLLLVPHQSLSQHCRKPRTMDFTRWRRWYRRCHASFEAAPLDQGHTLGIALDGEQVSAAAVQLWARYAATAPSQAHTQDNSQRFGLQLDLRSSGSLQPPPGASHGGVLFAEPDSLCCIITGELLLEPLLSLTSGHTYERSTLMALIAANDPCPMTRRRLGPACAVPNRALEHAVATWVAFKESNLPHSLAAGGAGGAAAPSPRAAMEDDWLLVTSLSQPGLHPNLSALVGNAALAVLPTANAVPKPSTTPPVEEGAVAPATSLGPIPLKGGGAVGPPPLFCSALCALGTPCRSQSSPQQGGATTK